MMKMTIFWTHFGYVIAKVVKMVEKCCILRPYPIDSASFNSKNEPISKISIIFINSHQNVGKLAIEILVLNRVI